MLIEQTERRCRNCGGKLSRYNPEILCWSCQKEKHMAVTGTVAPPSLFPFPQYQSAFMLRSILDTVRRSKPIQLSDVGQTLKYYRHLHQLTQRDLAALLGFNQSYISKLENGQGLREIATIKHIANTLCIPGYRLGLDTDNLSHESGSEIIEIAPSLIRLSQTVRETGRADAAINELWPLHLRLETLASQEPENIRLLLTLASAQATLGVILGDLLPEEDLWISVHFFKKAISIAEAHGNNMMKAEVYRGCGNELRKHKQYIEALSYLEKAFSHSPDDLTRGQTAALLARTYGEMRDKENFNDVMASVLHAQDKLTYFSPTFNPVTIREVHIRGLLNLEQLNDIPSLLERDSSAVLSVSVAPQWQVISQITIAEAQFHSNKVDAGLTYLKASLIGAQLCKLPHQIQRAIRTLQKVEAYEPAKSLGYEAKTLLDGLMQHTYRLPTSQE